MSAGDGGTRKHKWSSPTELSPHKFLKGNESKLPRSFSDSRHHRSESHSMTQDRRVTLYSPQTVSHESPDSNPGETSSQSARARASFSGRLRRSWPIAQHSATLEPPVAREYTEERQSKGDDDLKKSNDSVKSQKDDTRNRTHRAQAPSMLFMKAFRDIIGKSNRTSVSPAKPSETECREESGNVQEAESVNSPKAMPETDSNHLPVTKERAESPRPEGIVFELQSEPEAQEEKSRLVFFYEDDSDKDRGSQESNSEKDPSIGSDFSDLEDVGPLARFSQEELSTSCCQPSEVSDNTSSNYIMYPSYLYSSNWNNYTEPWTSSFIYKQCSEQNTWRQEKSNSSHSSELSSSLVETSVCSDPTGERRERSKSTDALWTHENLTKLTRRSSDTLSPAESPKSPKFLQEGFIDTHCHLDMLFSKLSFSGSFAQLRKDYYTTFPREFQGCIADFCDPGTLHDHQWEHLLGEDMVWGAFGCHPHFAQYYTSQKQEAIMNALRHPKAIAYGEMGLDYSHKCSTTIPVQHTVFEKQLKLAVALGKPLVIHCRDADDDLFQILKKFVPWDYKIHRHCFTGNYSQIEPFLLEFPNMSVGFTALLTYPSAQDARDAMRQIPLERLIVETDAPFFVPKQVSKGICKFSHPGLALHTVQEMARQKDLSVTSVLNILRQNTQKLYNV